MHIPQTRLHLEVDVGVTAISGTSLSVPNRGPRRSLIRLSRSLVIDLGPVIQTHVRASVHQAVVIIEGG